MAALSDFRQHHVSISVGEIDQAIDWYGKVFGFEIEHRMESKGIPARGAFIKKGPMRIELWQTIPGAKVPEERKLPNTDLHAGGTKHVAFMVPDLKTRLAELAGQGVDIAAIQPERTKPMNHHPDLAAIKAGQVEAFAVFIRDPFGTLIELLDAASVGDGV